MGIHVWGTGALLRATPSLEHQYKCEVWIRDAGWLVALEARVIRLLMDEPLQGKKGNAVRGTQ